MATKKTAPKKSAPKAKIEAETKSPPKNAAPKAVLVGAVCISAAAFYGGMKWHQTAAPAAVNQPSPAPQNALAQNDIKLINDQITMMGERFVVLSGALAQLQTDIKMLKAQQDKVAEIPTPALPIASNAAHVHAGWLIAQIGERLRTEGLQEKKINQLVEYLNLQKLDGPVFEAAQKFAEVASGEGVSQLYLLEESRKLEGLSPVVHASQAEPAAEGEDWKARAKRQFNTWIHIQKVKDYEASQAATWGSEWAQLRVLISQGKAANAALFFKESHLGPDERLAAFGKKIEQYERQKKAFEVLENAHHESVVRIP